MNSQSKNLEDTIWKFFLKSRALFEKYEVNRKNDTQTKWIIEQVTQRLRLSLDTDVAEIVKHLKSMSEEERKEKLSNVFAITV